MKTIELLTAEELLLIKGGTNEENETAIWDVEEMEDPTKGDSKKKKTGGEGN